LKYIILSTATVIHYTALMMHVQRISAFLTVLCMLLPPAVAGTTIKTSPTDAVTVFVKGEGGYYCHKIPYLYRTANNVLIALAEGRGKDGRDACDDFSVC
jgi:hypothetical protein